MVEVLTSDASPRDYQVQAVHLDWATERLRIWLKGPTGLLEAHTYSGDQAMQLMRQLNKADLGAKSLHRRILERLQADGKLPGGQVQGVPD